MPTKLSPNNTSCCSFGSLPDFIFEEVVDYLDLETRLKLRLVSKNWERILLPLIWRYFEYLGKNDYQVTLPYLKKYGGFVKQILLYLFFPPISNILEHCYSISEVELVYRSEDGSNFEKTLISLSSNLPKLKSLNISLRNPSPTIPPLILFNLVALNLEMELYSLEKVCKTIYASCLPMLQMVSLTLEGLNQATLDIIQARFTNIHTLKIRTVFHPLELSSELEIGAFKKLVDLELYLLYPEEISHNISSLVSPKKTPKLQRLSLHLDTKDLSPAYESLLSLAWKNVVELSLGFISESILCHLLNRFPKLQSLRLKELDFEFFDARRLIKELPFLKALEFVHCARIIDVGLVCVDCTNLTRLEFSETVLDLAILTDWLLNSVKLLFYLKILHCRIVSTPDKIKSRREFCHLVYLYVNVLFPKVWREYFIISAPNLDAIYAAE